MTRAKPDFKRIVDIMFVAGDRVAAQQIMDDVTRQRIPGLDEGNHHLRHRIFLAILKNSNGDIPRLTKEVEQAKIDWRDSLMTAGFESDQEAHHLWERQILRNIG